MALATPQPYLFIKPDRDWTADKYWLGKDQPSYDGQIETSDGRKIELFSWRQPAQDKIEILRECVGLLHPKLVLPTRFILFDNADMQNPYDPSELCTGYRRRSERAIQFYPYAYISAEDHKGLVGVPIWKGAIVHEFAHNQDFYPEIMEAWLQEFGWVTLNEPKQVTVNDGSCIQIEYECRQPEKLITRYAGYKPSEDFSESMVAALFCPRKLDPGKLAFIQQYFNKSEKQRLARHIRLGGR